MQSAAPHRTPEPELPPGLLGPASPRAGLAYRTLRVLWWLVARLLGLRLRVEGLERLPRRPDGRPAGGWIAAGLPHRTWIDPFVLWAVLPAEPRLVFLGDARAMARSRLRRAVVRLVGGVVPIPARGGPRAFGLHLAAAAAVLDAGAVFCLFPEVGPPTPPGTTRALGGGLGYVALRSGAPIVPVVLGGTHELYLGRTIVVRILEPMSAAALAGIVPDAAPGPGSPDERAAAHRVVEALRAAVAAAVAAAHDDAEPPSGTHKRLRRLTTLFR